MSKIEMKPAMSMDEMSEAYAQDNPGFIPNRNAVGRYARKPRVPFSLAKNQRCQTIFLC